MDSAFPPAAAPSPEGTDPLDGLRCHILELADLSNNARALDMFQAQVEAYVHALTKGRSRLSEVGLQIGISGTRLVVVIEDGKALIREQPVPDYARLNIVPRTALGYVICYALARLIPDEVALRLIDALLDDRDFLGESADDQDAALQAAADGAHRDWLSESESGQVQP